MAYLSHGMEAEVVNSRYSACKDPQGHVKVPVTVEQLLLESYFLKQHDAKGKFSVLCLDLKSTLGRERTHHALGKFSESFGEGGLKGMNEGPSSHGDGGRGNNSCRTMYGSGHPNTFLVSLP